MSLLDIRNLSVTFDTPRGDVPAVRDVTLSLAAGEILGLVGESGSGKSAASLALLRILDPSARIGGQVFFDGRDLLSLRENEMRQVRGAGLSMIFQEPMTALNPVMKIGDQIGEALRAHQSLSWREAREVALDMLRQVAIPEPEMRMGQYPHHLSGGMRQRVMIAMALVAPARLKRPAVLIADEPTTALDVTIQAQILALLKQLRDRFGLAILLITHDLGVVAETADRVAVMYAGRIVECGPLRDVFGSPTHPYTRGLLRVAPSLEGARGVRLPVIPGSAPNPMKLPLGCSFEPRCEARMDQCVAGIPPFVEFAQGRGSRCVRAGEVQARIV
jgi:oligopeptide/dipeptide ABC transporter ATP-binding protein